MRGLALMLAALCIGAQAQVPAEDPLGAIHRGWAERQRNGLPPDDNRDAYIRAFRSIAAGNAAMEAAGRRGMKRLIGKPIDAAIKALGFPDDERVIAGRRAVIWKRHMVEGSEGRTYSLECKVAIEVSAKRIVTGGSIDGNAGACRDYRERLGRVPE